MVKGEQLKKNCWKKRGGSFVVYSFPDGGTVRSLRRRKYQVITGNCFKRSYSRRMRGSFRIELEYSWMSTPPNAPLAKPGIVVWLLY